MMLRLQVIIKTDEFTDGELQENDFHKHAIFMYFPQKRRKKHIQWHFSTDAWHFPIKTLNTQ